MNTYLIEFQREIINECTNYLFAQVPEIKIESIDYNSNSIQLKLNDISDENNDDNISLGKFKILVRRNSILQDRIANEVEQIKTKLRNKNSAKILINKYLLFK